MPRQAGALVRNNGDGIESTNAWVTVENNDRKMSNVRSTRWTRIRIKADQSSFFKNEVFSKAEAFIFVSNYERELEVARSKSFFQGFIYVR